VTEIRSYRRVFDLERRIYSVDQLRLNPGGVPLRGLAYFLALVALALILGGLPLVGALSASLPWYLRDVLLPAAAATLLGAVRIEGRAFHLAAHALLRHRLRARTYAGGRRVPASAGRWYPREIVLLPDGSDARLRKLRYHGPGAALVCVEHRRRGRAAERGAVASARPGLRAALTLSQAAAGRPLPNAQVIVLPAGAKLNVRAGRGAARPSA